MRVTVNILQAQINTANRMLNKTGTYSEIGALTLSQAYGGYSIHQYVNEFGGITDLIGGHHPAKEVNRFLSGMIAALRITQHTPA